MTNFVFLQAAQPQQGNPWSMFIFLILLFVIMYFFMIRPQAKRQKELRKFRESLQEGDKVVTIGGIYGKVAQIKDNKVVLEVANGVKITFDKSSILRDPSDLQQQA